VAARKQVLVLPPSVLHPEAMTLLHTEVDVILGFNLEPVRRMQTLATAHGLVGGGTAEHIADAHALEVIGIPGSGSEHIAVEAATAAGVAVVNAAGGQHSAVAEHAVGLMLSLAKRIALSDRLFHTERRFYGRDHFTGDGWPGFPQEIGGKTVGIVGFGFIGRDLARKCRLGFDMPVLAYDPYVDPDEVARQGVELVGRLDDLLERSDFVSLHLPLTPETRHIMGEAQFRRMKPTAYFVNLSRGGTVDEAALVRALDEHWIAGAGTDVFDQEPAPDGHPLFGRHDVVLTGHIGGWVVEAVPRLAVIMAREMLAVLRGERPWRFVNPSVWPRLQERQAAAARG
jgi:D-3-phosphoglycerate dehydrogenase / 2-oxoglutarate reductase